MCGWSGAERTAISAATRHMRYSLLLYVVLLASFHTCNVRGQQLHCLSSRSTEELSAWLRNSSSTPLSCYRWQRHNGTSHPAGSVVLGALIPLYEDDATTSIASRHPCTKSTGIIGFQLVEALYQSLNEALARNPRAEQLISAVEIRDSCSSSRYCSAQAMWFAKNSPQAQAFCAANASDFDARLQDPGSAGSELNGASSQCSSVESRVPLVIGPAGNRALSTVSDALSVHRMPHITYWAPSSNDANRASPFLFRTTPSVTYQARAMVQLLAMYDWNYVTVISSVQESLDNGFLHLFTGAVDEHNLAENETLLCISAERFFLYDDQKAVRSIVEWLVNQTSSNAVVLLADTLHAQVLFTALGHLSSEPMYRDKLANRQLVWLGNGDWIWTMPTIIASQPVPLVGKHTFISCLSQLADVFDALNVQFNRRFTEKFSNYTSTKADTLVRNPWLSAFWGKKHNCCSAMDTGSISSPLLEPVRSGSLAMAMQAAVHVVERAFGTCTSAECLWRVSGLELSDMMSSATVPCSNTGSGNTSNRTCALFAANGEVPPLYRVVNLQIVDDGLSVRTVGYWNLGTSASGGFSWNSCHATGPTNSSKPCFMWGIDFTASRYSAAPPTSICSRECVPGQYRYYNESEYSLSTPCCWTCEDCKENNMVSLTPNEPCRLCPHSEGKVPNDDFTACVNRPSTHRGYDSVQVAVTTSLCAFGGVIVILTAVLLIRHRDTSIAHIGHFRFSLLLLLGLLSGFIVAACFFFTPTTAYCTTRTVVSVAVLLYTAVGPLLRVLHLNFANQDQCQWRGLRRVSVLCCSSFRRMIVTSLIAVGVWSLSYVVLRAVQPIHPDVHLSNGLRFLKCGDDWTQFLPLAVLLLIIVATDVVAFMSRKLRGNYSEAMWVMFTSFALTTEWIVLIALVFIDQASQDLSVAVIIFAHMSTIWGCLYGPRVYIVLFRSQRNAPYIRRQSTTLTLAMRTGSAGKDSSTSTPPPGENNVVVVVVTSPSGSNTACGHLLLKETTV